MFWAHLQKFKCVASTILDSNVDLVKYGIGNQTIRLKGEIEEIGESMLMTPFMLHANLLHHFHKIQHNL